MLAHRIRVTGVVQGVGFRPFVWRLAQQLQLTGWVRNDAQGVELLAQGSALRLAELLERLRLEAPPLARVATVQAQAALAEAFTSFTILASQSGQASTAIGPDVAVCFDCLDELFEPTSRRYRHAFITCTHCGPRFTVTRELPYDRPQTSMAPFPLCPACGTDYTAPANRRFHAETTCCPQCGPRLTLSDPQAQAITGDPIAQTLQLLQSGHIVAIKGLGGFHLACDARNPEALARLRWRKNREAKPLAVMLANVASVAPYAQVSDAERALLESRERPIVLLRTAIGGAAALPGVAPGLLNLGVMLPTTPIHFLLFHEAAGRPAGTQWLSEPQAMVLVLTSANPGGEPIVRDSLEAHTRLADIADAFLDHDRDIVARCDDSVIAPMGAGWQFIRRSRGYAPAAISLPHSGPSVLAFGAHLKNTVCVTRGNEAYLSPHIGDLDNAASCAFLDETVQRLCDLLNVKPSLVAHDLHPDDYSTRAAISFAAQHGLPTLAVQHHHAHIGAVCAEHGWHGALLGLALDGVGLGTDATAWGGELLKVEGAQFERLGHLRPLALPGGDKAAREPWRMAACVWHELGRNADIPRRFQEPGAATVATMLERQFNCPRTSSMGRVFDAAAALLGLCSYMTYEALAPVLLAQEATIFIEEKGWPDPMTDGWTITDSGQLNLLPLLASLDCAPDVNQAAARFHATLIAALTDWVMRAADATGLKTLAWGGGCFLNTLLSSGLRQNLEQRGLTVLAPIRTSPGDGSIALGQAWVGMNYLETN
ncbi:MAG: carbamoyltransferase HypF [Gammaproteobacteria bacterium]|uniref:carbamoyltransferase HypF n=1 Tax=Rhodoferax sp. TaxID=50421 RepID=UPI0018306790|nr:carbamoyltransferase HypF [Rhodoferax sp.]MBU3898393.1 carbamoyltransferase HypF [Gammaproteobacteria bacterium]MBA3059342.1 carbamoyltransferase HypF [Rhodoferax sp.]MBU3998112.1 carbamoyltransferase HypF [Gammaproteobacteria bacterium]MBU4079167.1 carbamoyltransferase HypF [Gammaproteobacteria bacterium]MBU4113768.1 carbamoyltransferase HypF [Gammaproteobacteria bacterium]